MKEGEGEGKEGNACRQTPRFWKPAFASERSAWLARLVEQYWHDRPCGRFSKSRGLSASVSFLSSPPPSRSFTYAIFPAVFDLPRSLLLNRTETLATQASRIGLCSLTSTGSKEVLPGNRKMHLLRRDVRLNDVNWSLVATSLLGNSGYQTDRKIYDQSKMTLRLAISWEPRGKQIPTDLLT